jgi:hypothetical protein
MYSRANGLNFGIFLAVVVAGGNNVAVELVADFNAIFFDGGLGAHLHNTRFKDFNAVSYDYFFKSHFDTPIKIKFWSSGPAQFSSVRLWSS